MALYHIENLSFKYNQSEKGILKNLNFDIEAGDFVLLSGSNGSGKSTLLRLLKKNITSYGTYDGIILFNNIDIRDLDDLEAAKNVAYLCQNTDEQIVTDKVYHELAFPLENFGVSSDKIKIRLAEISSFFNIENLFYKNIKSLSGGQKQIVNIASLMTLNPKVILLDEPTSQLDPLGRQEFIDYLDKINKIYGTTIIIIEHNINEVIHLSNKIIFMSDGTIKYYDDTKTVLKLLSKSENEKMFLPTITKIFVDNNIDYFPIDIRDGKKYIEKNKITLRNTEDKNCKRIANDEKLEAINSVDIDINKVQKKSNDNVHNEYNEKNQILNISNISYRYGKNDSDVLSSLNLDIYKNEVLTIFGGNGSGKTTLFKNISKILKPYIGSIYYAENFANNDKKELYRLILNKKNDCKKININNIKNEIFYNYDLVYLPQDIKSIFTKNTIREELIDSHGMNYMDKVHEFDYDFSTMLDRHPYDLSGGEMQLLSLLKIINGNQKILLLDEPTKGLDAIFKNKFVNIISKYKSEGHSVLIITHDVELAEKISDRCAMLFMGEIVYINNTKEFLENNLYWTTTYYKLYATNKI